MFGQTSGQESMTTASESKRKADTATADDADTLLPEAALTKLMDAQVAYYHVAWDIHTAPSEPSVSSLYLEGASNVPTAHLIYMVKSVMLCNFAKRQRKEEVSKRVSFSCEADEEVAFQNLIDYYFDLRASGEAFAIAGCCEAQSHHACRNIFYALHYVQLNYTDMTLRLASRASGGAVQWEMERDTQTRAKMIPLMRSGCTQGEALTCAIKETSLLWQADEVLRATQLLGDDYDVLFW